jgi:hypothetical protein
MSTFARTHSSYSRLANARLEVRPHKYDTRVLDHFYAYCSAVARADRHRAAATNAQRAMKRRLWAMIIGASVLGYHLVERVAQAMSQF